MYRPSFQNDDHLHPLSTTSLDALGGEWKGCVRLGVLGFDKRFGVGTSFLFHRLAPSISYTFTITQLAYFLYLIDKLIQV
jgi:hypothetical protein